MFIQLQIPDLIIGFQIYMMKKIQDLIDIYYQLQNNCAVLLCCLSNKHTFLDLNFDKV